MVRCFYCNRLDRCHRPGHVDPSARSLGDPNFDSGRPKMLKATEAARLHGNSWHLWLNHGRMAHGHDSFLCPMVMLHIDGPNKSM